FIAAGMAEENWLRVALTAMALGVGLYLIPLGMIARPDLIRLAKPPAGDPLKGLSPPVTLAAPVMGWL
ncbi:MAG: TRAP transporter permease DctM/Q, partial [Alphaproteobacteria bacterium]|nr:TRAP transporter permease DctM/Q [Alphaproteobacteria bacterium]